MDRYLRGALSKECAAIAGCSPRDQIYLAEATRSSLPSHGFFVFGGGGGGRMDSSCAFHLFEGVNSSFGTREEEEEEEVFPRDFLDF